MKTLNLNIYIAILLIFTACGKVETSNTQDSTADQTPLTLKIDNKNIYSTSSSRIQVTVNAEQNICVVSINKNGSIILNGGKDMDLFELISQKDSKILRFISTPETSNPIDNDKDGIYEIDIQASDYDGNSITYKVAYKIYNKNTDAYTISLPYAEIRNYSPSDISAPRIQSFSITGNRIPQNDKVIISKSKLNAKFNFSFTLKDEIYADTLSLGFKGGSKAIGLNYIYGDLKTLNFDCTLDSINGINQGINYTCNDISIENTKGSTDTHIVLSVCNNTSHMCSSARIPVLFTP